MSSKLILDKSDEGVAEMVAAWKDGGVYRVEIEFTQDSNSPNTTDNTVTSVTNLSDGSEEEVAEPMEEVPEKKAPKGGMIPK